VKRQNLSVDCLDRIFDAIIVSKLLYASQSWFGYINEHVYSPKIGRKTIKKEKKRTDRYVQR